MPKENRKARRLDRDTRLIIQGGLEEGLAAREIARLAGVSPSTVSREVRANRTVKVPKRKDMTAAARCARFGECRVARTVCAECSAPKRTRHCRWCRAVKCYDHCQDFVLRRCEKTESWPYVCSCHAFQRTSCMLPKCDYRADRAQDLAFSRRSVPRRGVSVTAAELERMVAVVGPLVRKGQSLEAIWATHGHEFPVGSRTFYNYIESGLVDIVNLELPRKVRYKQRRRRDSPKRDRIDRTGRTYEDFMGLPEEQRYSAAQMDTVLGFRDNRKRILSIQFRRLIFQLYALLPDGRAASVVGALDAMEISMGSREAFAGCMGTILADRGEEFDDFRGIERSVLEPGRKRCSVYYCDAMSPSQKPNCERNHEELRRILPKGRSDFDELGAWDVATACSHVNSYPRRALGGACPIQLASQVLPSGLLEGFGIERVDPDDVTLKPDLLPHVRKQ